MDNKKIVIIDDDTVILQGMMTALELGGFKVECMSNGRHSKEMIIAAKPDIVFLDISLNDADGGAIAEILKNDPATSHIPIVMVSANQDIEAVTEESGADDFLAKPFSVSDIINKAKYHLAKLEKNSPSVTVVS